MTPMGWLFLAASLGFVWGLTGWCFYKVLTTDETPDQIPEPVKEFHSA